MNYIYLMDTNMDLNVENYSQDDLLALLDFSDTDDVTYKIPLSIDIPVKIIMI